MLAGGLSGGGRLARLYALAKELRTAEALAEWEQRVVAGRRASSARGDLAAHSPGFGVGAPRRTGAASSASVHVAPRASTGSGAGAGSLLHPERAKSHGQWLGGSG